MRTRKRKQRKSYFLFGIPILLALTFSTFLFTEVEPYYNYDWSGIRNEVKDTLIGFCMDHEDITAHAVGEAARTPRQWYRYKFLRNNLTSKEAEKLKSFPKDKVKALAYEVSIRKNPDKLYSLMSEALNDTTTFINYQIGCEGITYLLAEYLNYEVCFLGLDSTQRAPVVEDPQKLIGKEKYHYLDSLYDYRVSKKWDYIKY